MEILCSDLNEILNLLVPEKHKHFLTDICTDTLENTVPNACGLLNFYLSKLNISLPEECEPLITPIIQCVCASSTDKPKPITISAKMLNTILDKALTMSKVTDYLKKTIGFTGTTRSEVCQTLVDLVSGDWTVLAKLITQLITDKLPTGTDITPISTLVSTYTPRLFGTVCTGLKPKDNLPVVINVTNYNWIPIMVVVAAVVVLALIPMLCVVLSKSTQHNLTYYLVILAVVSLILVAVFVANPICLFQTCYQKSQTWKPMKGQYTGKGGAPGLDISISATISFKDSNTVVLDKLECAGSLCHDTKNLLVKCTSPAQFDPKKQTTLGYELTGDCVDGIKAQIGGGSSLEGIYLAQVNDQNSKVPLLYVQVKVIFRELATIIAYVLLAKV